MPDKVWGVQASFTPHSPGIMGLNYCTFSASAHRQAGAWYSSPVRSILAHLSAFHSALFALAAIKGSHLAKPNYQYEKRQRDLAKKNKQEEKRRQKLADKAAAEAGVEQSGAAPSSDDSSAASPESGLPSEA